MTKKRDQCVIVKDILIAIDKTLIPTGICFEAKLAYANFNRLIKVLLKHELISETVRLSKKQRNIKRYYLLDKGRAIIDLVDELQVIFK